MPSLTLPTSDYNLVVKMSNHAVVGVFRKHVWSVRQRSRFSVSVPDEHDAYMVRRQPNQVVVKMIRDGKEVFRCIFVPPVEY
ncbi:MAG: hypothetical protein RR250_02095 [Akkermansia sp.]